MKRVSVIVVLLVLLMVSAALAQQSRTVQFRERTIDLKPYFEGFPYSDFQPFYAANKLYYYHIGETTKLQQVNLSGNVDLSKGTTISDIDFATRNVWGIRYNQAAGKLFWIGDEKNDEIINLYSLDPKTKELKKYTDVPYIFGWRWNEEADKVAYIARLGHIESRLGEARVLDLNTGEEEVIMKDNPDMRFTWTNPSYRPNGKGIVVTVLKDADRNQGNLAYVDFETKNWKILTDPAIPRNWPNAFREWMSNDIFVYSSNEDGFENLYKYDLAKGVSTQLTFFKRDIGDSDMITDKGKKYIFCVIATPIQNTLVVVDPENGRVLREQDVDTNVEILDSDGNKLLLSCTSATSKFEIDEMVIAASSKKDLKFQRRVDVPKDLKKQIVHCSVERIEYPTFDKDENTGKQRMLHAFLYVPDKPLPKDEQIVMIQSFYGGENSYSTRNQILTDAGIYVLSPSPRGSSGFGREFAALNDKDLGGNEIVDVIYAARYISDKLGVPPARVGVFGGSHGGYATMRCLTFPGEINGNKASFDWGFGISHAGFSDIIHFYENCNIPDWVILEAGDPKTEAAKLRDRSPLYHADKAVGKLLLTHGTNDSRVPILGSRAMADSLRKYDKDVTLIEFEGQGHGIKGLENSIRFYNTWFEFLETLPTGDGHASR